MSKNVTIRLQDETHEFIKTNFEGMQSGVSIIVESFDKLRLVTIAELKGYFSEAELIALTDSQNGVMLTPDFVYNKSFLLAQLEDFEMLESGISRHNADAKILFDKIKQLSHSQVYFLVMHLHIFWQTGGQDLNEQIKKMM